MERVLTLQVRGDTHLGVGELDWTYIRALLAIVTL
jgi:hypothetical protein